MNPSILPLFLEKGLGPIVEKLPFQETFSQKKKRSLAILNRLEKSGNSRKMSFIILVIFK